MRKKLKKKNGVRETFTGIFERFGTKNGYRGPKKTILLKNIRDNSGKLVTNHLWFNFTKGFKKANLKPGDKVEFRARVKEYEKGYMGYRDDVFKPIEKDYKLNYPTKIKKID